MRRPSLKNLSPGPTNVFVGWSLLFMLEMERILAIYAHGDTQIDPFASWNFDARTTGKLEALGNDFAFF